MYRIITKFAGNCYRYPLQNCMRCATVSKPTIRLNSSEVAVDSSSLTPPPPLDGSKTYEPKIVGLVDSISNLTLREVADLNELLKSSLNIKDIAMAAPVLGSAAAQAPAEEEEEEKAPEKDEFAIKLVGFNAADKIKLIKALKVLKPSLNLVQAKKLVETTPQVIIDDASKEDSENIKKTLEEAGGKVEIV